MAEAKIRTVRYIDGVSESLWKSTVVKSLRIGWPTGLQAASRRLSKTTMENLLLVGLFEDVFPTMEELPACVAEIKRGDYVALCSRDTHHGKGLADEFCDLEEEAVAWAGKQALLIATPPFVGAFMRQYGMWLQRRAYNVYYTWESMLDRIPMDARRSVDKTEWYGIPNVMADLHTVEGRQLRQRVTMLSGTYAQHRQLGVWVQEHGWDWVREKAHEDGAVRGIEFQTSLF